ncbi:MAG: hypothetical protein ACPGVS_08790 [Primorskyibacter sp.]
MRLLPLSPLNWLNIVLIAVIVVAGARLSVREDLSTSAIDVQPHHQLPYQTAPARL